MLGHIRIWKTSKEGRAKAARARLTKTGNEDLVQRFDALQDACIVEACATAAEDTSVADDLTVEPSLLAATTPPLPMAKARPRGKAKAKAKAEADGDEGLEKVPTGSMSQADKDDGFTILEGGDFAQLAYKGGLIYSKPNEWRFRVFRPATHELGKLDQNVCYKSRGRSEGLVAAKLRMEGPANGMSKPAGPGPVYKYV